MGETNPETVAKLKELTGHEHRHGMTPDGQQCLHVGDLKIVAARSALWGEPRVFDHGDGLISIMWGGRTVQLHQQSDATWLQA